MNLAEALLDEVTKELGRIADFLEVQREFLAYKSPSLDENDIHTVKLNILEFHKNGVAREIKKFSKNPQLRWPL